MEEFKRLTEEEWRQRFALSAADVDTLAIDLGPPPTPEPPPIEVMKQS